jgi:predicted Ser/Thr protein kinase
MTSPIAACPRCTREVTPGLRECPGCGFDLVWDQGMVTTAAVDSGAFMTTARMPQIVRPIDVLAHATNGEYEILNELGRGGMAVVFLAREVALDRKVAIKLISPSVIDGHEAIERFKREARTAASLSHPGVIPIYAVRENDHALFFVMKYVNGRTLSSILRSAGPLPVTLVRNIITSVASALDYAHRNGVIHRDIKPGNIMVDTEGHVLVTDFGIAKVADSAGLTTTGRTIGTPAYMSPEACAGKAVDGGSDQYSLGVVAYEILAGRNPFMAENSVGIMYAHVHEDPQPIGELRPDCPPEMAEAVMRMISKDALKRFPSLKEVALVFQAGQPTDEMAIASLGALAASRGGSDSAIPTPVPRRTPARTGTTTNRVRRGTLAWVIVGTLVLAAAIFFGLSRIKLQAAPRPEGDSALVATRASAIAARARATASGLSAASLAGGDSIVSAAQAMVDSGRTAEAAALFGVAASIWDSLLTPRSAGSQRTTSAPPAARPSNDSAPTPAPVLSDSAAIASYYGELAAVIEARQLGEVRRLLPNIDDFQADAWRRLFADENVEKIEASYAVLAVTVQENQVHARVSESVLVTKSGKTTPRNRSFFAVLTRGPQGWREIREEK